MRVNGKQIVLHKRIALSEFLEHEGFDQSKIAVERNGSIVPAKSFETEILAEDDCIEIVSFVGGG